jgi:hypothetical protein
MTSSLRLVTPRSLKAASTGGFTRPLALAARADLMALLDLLDLREGNPGRFAYHLRKAVRVRIGELEEDIEARLDELEHEYAEANGQSFQAALFEEDEKARERAAEEKKQILAERHRLAEEARQARLEAKLARQRVQAEDDERRATKSGPQPEVAYHLHHCWPLTPIAALLRTQAPQGLHSRSQDGRRSRSSNRPRTRRAVLDVYSEASPVLGPAMFAECDRLSPSLYWFLLSPLLSHPTGLFMWTSFTFVLKSSAAARLCSLAGAPITVLLFNTACVRPRTT